MTDDATLRAFDEAYEQRFAHARAEAPHIAAELLARKRTLAQAISSARWHFHGFFADMIVDRLHELHAARETAPAPLKPRIRRPRGASPMLPAAGERPLPPVRRRRG